MKGVIAKVNARRGMVAIKTEGSSYSIFEHSGSEEFNIGDEVEWRGDTSLGDTLLENKTHGQCVRVLFQNHEVGPEILDLQLRL